MVTVRHTAQTASVHDHWLTGKCLPGPCKVVISPPCGMSNVDLSDYIFTPLQHKACFCSVLTATLVELVLHLPTGSFMSFVPSFVWEVEHK